MTSLPKTFQSKGTRILPWYAIGAGVVAFASGLASTASGNLRGLPVVVAGLAIVLYGATIAWRLGAVATQDYLVLRGPTGSRHLDWHDVDRVDLMERYPFSAYVVMKDGSRIKTTGLGASNIGHKSSMDASRALVRGLNEIRAEVLGAEEPDAD